MPEASAGNVWVERGGVGGQCAAYVSHDLGKTLATALFYGLTLSIVWPIFLLPPLFFAYILTFTSQRDDTNIFAV